MATPRPPPSESSSSHTSKTPAPGSAPESTPIVSLPSSPAHYEEANVHAVYEQIAPHFSSTRYKAWPIVKQFLEGLPAGSIGLDIGCGNGKYLLVNPNVFIIGSDRSTNLAKIARGHQPHAAIVADTLALPHPESSFDFAISIAVIHHLSTPARRREAIASILSTLSPKFTSPSKPAGKALIYVWALEQSTSRRGWDSSNPQDVMVPWVMRTGKKLAPDGSVETPASEQTFQRYYHLYREGELEEDIRSVGGVVVENGYERDNWWAVCSRGEEDAESVATTLSG